MTLVVSVIVLVASSANIDASQNVFDELFGAKIERAQATTTKADDLALARELAVKGNLPTLY